MPDLLPCFLLAASGGVTPVMGLLAVLLVALVLLSLVLTKLRQSLLIGYFACGVAAANSGLLELLGGEGLHERMNVFADTGVALLMFTLGIEFSLSELKHLRKAALVGGGVQMGLTALLTGFAAWWCGLGPSQAIVLAVAVALSSTAVSMKTFQELGMPASPAARASLGIAIFQDLLVIAFMLLLPMILNESSAGGHSLLVTGEFVLLFLAFAWVLGRYLIPRLLLSVSRTQSRELFTLTVLALCVSVACLASLMGLSPALGAFVAGLVVSGSIYSHRVLADVLPFKDLFLTLFFVTVGLTIDLSVLARYGWWVLGATLFLLLVKGAVLALSCRLLAMPVRSAVMCTAALASTGEFSLVLMARSRDSLAWDDAFYQVFVLSTALSMALVPTLMRKAPTFAEWLEKSLLIKARKGVSQDASVSQKTKTLSDHAILCGYGVVGKQLHEELAKAGVPCLIIELNVDTVRNLKRQGVPVLFADATHRETWDLARVQSARLVAFTFPDAAGAINSLAHVREQAPTVPVIARVKFAADADAMRDAGATHVVFDEVESAAAAVRAAREEFEIAVE
jgi:CPA2 family monovalent cation:H+ antiporter-2